MGKSQSKGTAIPKGPIVVDMKAKYGPKCASCLLEWTDEFGGFKGVDWVWIKSKSLKITW